MRQGHNNLRDWQGGRGQARTGRGALVGFAVLLAVAVSGRLAQAQFSGPAPGASTAVNPPVTITTDPAILYPGHRDVYLGSGDVLTVHLYRKCRLCADGTCRSRRQDPTSADRQCAGGGAHVASGPGPDCAETGKRRDVSRSSGDHSDCGVAKSDRHCHWRAAWGCAYHRGEAALRRIGGCGWRRRWGTGHGYDCRRWRRRTAGLQRVTSLRSTVPAWRSRSSIDLGTDPAKSALADIPIFPRDTIIVPRVGVVYLLGAFKTQGAIPLQQNSPMTLMKVAALTGGAWL